MVEYNECPKDLICKELDKAIKLSIFSSSLDNVITYFAVDVENISKNENIDFSQYAQALCNVIEAIFIHGLNDAFFLKGSRYSKYPEPNFWPFVSKFTHRNIRNQIAALKQIKNEIGKARAWIRIVLNENALENYANVLKQDKSQLNVFYQQNAFLCDSEKMETFIGYLKALSKLKIAIPANSSFLNSWIPTPLIMAGLCYGKVTRVSQLTTPLKRHNSSSVSLGNEEEETEVGINALELLDDPLGPQALFTVGSPGIKNTTDADDEDERSSVYSHPSLLDGAINTIQFRPNFNSVLSSTPENLISSSFPIEEFSSEVIVKRKKTRLRRVSRGNLDFGNSRNRSKTDLNRAIIDKSSNHENENSLEGISETVRTTSDDTLAAQMQVHKLYMETKKLFRSDNKELGYFIGESTSTHVGIDLPSSSVGLTPPPSQSESFEIDSGERKSLASDIVQSAFNSGTNLERLLQEEHLGRNETTTSVSSSSLNELTNRINYSISANNAPSCSSSIGTDALSPSLYSFNNNFRNALQNCHSFVNNIEHKFSQSSSLTTDDENCIPKGNFWREELSEQVSKSATSAPISVNNTTTVPLWKNLELEDKDRATSCVELDDMKDFNYEGTKSCKVVGEEYACELLVKKMDLEYKPYEIDEIPKEDEVIVVDNKCLEGTDEYGISKDLLQLTKIPIEKGLDAQEFRCPSCRKSIGGLFGTFRLCNLDFQYYCEDCWRRGDESIIPARLLWNWDCSRRPICKASKAFLKSIADVPFIRIDKLNMSLYEHSKPMKRILDLRTKLSLAVMYLLSCKQSIANDIRQRMAPQEYLHSDIHLYSILDLENVVNGSLEKRLNSLISFSVCHVDACALCFQKGFVCELCYAKRVIYPFQTEIASRCKNCFAVHHNECIKDKECPRCLRRAKYSIGCLSSSFSESSFSYPNTSNF